VMGGLSSMRGSCARARQMMENPADMGAAGIGGTRQRSYFTDPTTGRGWRRQCVLFSMNSE
ncbi:hypothetical protein, partial [Burkholderia gladioli]|uniref:hypothetical protein n=1 Tax=Burkholderia gladioli TaxID=28095 RepID=UPI001ABB39C2